MYIIYAGFNDFEMFYTGTEKGKSKSWSEDIAESTAYDSEEIPDKILLSIHQDYTKPQYYFVVWIDFKKKGKG